MVLVERARREELGVEAEVVGFMSVMSARRRIMGVLRGLRISLGVWRSTEEGDLWKARMERWEIGRRVGLIGLLLERECESSLSSPSSLLFGSLFSSCLVWVT